MQRNEQMKDVVIVGAGLVGASLAVALRDSPLRLAMVEGRPPVPAAGWDARVYAISPASRAFLDAIGVWPMLAAERIEPVRRMAVFGDDAGRLEFSAYENGVPELAWIVEGGAIARALWAGMAGQSNLEVICPAASVQLDVREASARLVLDTGRDIDARLVVGADGAQSFVRQQVMQPADVMPYGQSGVVANFLCERPHRGTAYQWFRNDGVLAWLPLPGQRMSMVWSTPESHAQALLALSPEQLCERVAAAGLHTLGGLECITAPAAFPLTKLTSRRLVAPRAALVGDAAHVVHPLAGQGVNLGFADAAALAGVIKSAHARADPGDLSLLRRFERARAEDILAMRTATDGLARLFRAGAPGLRRLRNIGMNSVDRLPVLKTLLVAHALGSR